MGCAHIIPGIPQNEMSDEILKYLDEHDKILLSRIRQKAEMNRRKNDYLEKHPFSIWEGTDGKWHTYLPDKIKGRLHRKRKTKAEIESLIKAFYADQEENPTVKEVFDEWNDRRLNLEKIARSTYDSFRGYFNRHYNELKKRKIKTVSPREWEEFLEEQIPKHNMTAKAFSNLKTITRGLLRRAKKRGLIDWNYEYMLSGIEISRGDFRVVKKEDYEEVFNEEETEIITTYFVEHLDPINMGLLLIFVSGLRIGELIALKPEDITNDTINIRRTVTMYKGENNKIVYDVKDFPKSASGWRTVVIPTEFEWLLRKIKNLNPWGTWIFERNGERLKEGMFEFRMRHICKKLGIYPKSPHKIRKTYATILMDNNVDTNMIIQQMGHTNILTSEQHYHRNRKATERKKMILDSLPEFKTEVQGIRKYQV